MVEITRKAISDDQLYVLIDLSDGTEIAITIDWATKFVQEQYTHTEEYIDDDGNPQKREVQLWRDTPKSLLEYEIEQATVLAQARADNTATAMKSAMTIIGD